MIYACDFETTTDENDCRVWAAGAYDIDTGEFIYYNTIDKFMNMIFKKRPSKIYFHNLKFDGEFILSWLFTNGYKYCNSFKLDDDKTFTTLIGDMGQFYCIKVRNKTKVINILDSLKIIPMEIREMPKAFGLNINKLELEYSKSRKNNYVLEETEIDYLYNDCKILALSLKSLFNQGLTHMTQAGNAFADFKSFYKKKEYDRYFPPPYYDSDIRQAYRGGYVFVNPKYKNKELGEGLVLDINSMYPWVMYTCLLPYGEGVFFMGKYEYDEFYPLYVQQFTAIFRIKEGYLPTVQIKHNISRFVPTEYITGSGDEPVALCMTSVDFKIFMEHYEIEEIEYIAGWKFKGTTELFKKYIDKWYTIKQNASREGNRGLRTIAKLMLNALYGRFALRCEVKSKIPSLGDDGIIHYSDSDTTVRDPVYIPVAVFITAYARAKLISSAQSVYDRFIYCDTDSLHILGTEIPDNLEIDDTKLGAWKVENHFTRAKFIRAKTYIEIIDNKLSVTCAGLPAKSHKLVTFDNFRHGQSYGGKLRPKRVKGGIVLVDTLFTIK